MIHLALLIIATVIVGFTAFCVLILGIAYWRVVGTILAVLAAVIFVVIGIAEDNNARAQAAYEARKAAAQPCIERVEAKAASLRMKAINERKYTSTYATQLQSAVNTASNKCLYSVR